MDANELQRLAGMGSSLRPDWPTRSLLTFLTSNFESRAYGDVAVALAWVATRTRTETPRLMLEAGPWWKAAASDGGAAGARPPKREEACATCGRRQADHSGPVIGDHPFVPLSHAARGRVSGAAAQARAELASIRASLCAHQIDRSRAKCADCDRNESKAAEAAEEKA